MGVCCFARYKKEGGMDFFKHSFMELAGWRDIEKYLSDGISPVCATGLSHIHKAQLLYTLSGKTGFLLLQTARRKQNVYAII